MIPIRDVTRSSSSCGMTKGLIAYLRLTDNCQLDCDHCFTGGQTGKKGFLDAQKTIDFFGRLSESVPDFSGTQFLLHGGEPFLAPTSLMFELHEGISKHYPTANWGAQTNLTYKLTQDKVKVLTDVCGKSWGTSWDVGIRWKTDRQYDLWRDNVRNLTKDDHFVTAMVSMDKAVIQTDPKEIMEMFADLGIANVLFERLTNNGSATENSSIFPTNKEVDDYYLRMGEAYWEEGLHKDIYNVFLEELLDSMRVGSKAGVNCRECEQKLLTVKADGSIAGCPDQANDTHYGTLGDPIEKILTSSSRMKAISHELERHESCYSCDVFDICNGGCHVADWDDTWCPSAKTLYRKLKLKFGR